MARLLIPSRGDASARRGFSLVEAVVSVLIVGVMLFAGLSTIGAMGLARRETEIVAAGPLLGQELMNEILAMEYEDPNDPPIFGVESTEGTADRKDWDDVDDYHGWIASPPQAPDGTPIPGYTGWERSVAVEWVTAADPSTTSPTPTGVKRITVTLRRDGRTLGAFTALRTSAWVGPTPPTPAKPVCLMVVADAASLTPQDLARQTLLDGWGYDVSFVSASATQADIDAAASAADVAYVVEQNLSTALGTKLRGAAIGVVVEEIMLSDLFGFSANQTFPGLRDDVDIDDNTHYISSPFALGALVLFSSDQPVVALGGSKAGGLETYGTHHFNGGPNAALCVIENGGALYGGGFAAGRRVQLPWGTVGLDINALDINGQSVLQRAIDWAAGREAP